MLKKYRFIILITFGLFCSLGLTAQPPCEGPNCGEDVDAPISGIELLLGAGALWGAKKFHGIKKGRKGRSSKL